MQRASSRARKLLERAQPFAAEPLIAVANFTWVRPGLAAGLPDWTLIGAGATRLWIVDTHRMRPDAGRKLLGDWPSTEVQLADVRTPRAIGPIPLGSVRAIRFEFPDRKPALLRPFGREVDALLEAHREARGQGSVRWDALAQVAVIASDDGPFDEVSLVLTYDDGETVFTGLSDAEALLPRLRALPGFDDEALSTARRVTGETTSVLWLRTD